MPRILFYGLLLFALFGCGGGYSIDPFSRKRADGKIPVSTDLIREQVRKELAGMSEEIATKERWTIIESDYNNCVLLSKKTDNRKAQAVFNQCMSDKGYLYLDQINAEHLHSEIEDEEKVIAKKAKEEAALLAAKEAKEHEAAIKRRWNNRKLVQAIKNEDYAAVFELSAKGADKNAIDDKGLTPLMYAIGNDHAGIVRLLLSIGADSNISNNKGVTPLMLAATGNHAEIAGMLLSAGAKPNAKNNGGWTALMIAAEEGYAETIKILLNAKADVDMKGVKGFTALIRAASKGHAEIAKILLEAGANPNRQGDSDGTALLYAMVTGNANVAKILLDCGANSRIRHKDSDDPWYYARENPTVLAVFEEYQRKIDSGWRPKSCKRG